MTMSATKNFWTEKELIIVKLIMVGKKGVSRKIPYIFFFFDFH